MVQSTRAVRRGVKRAVVKERFWRRHLSRQPRSGLSIEAYCARHGLSQASFYAWRAKLARRDAESLRFHSNRPTFLPVIAGGVSLMVEFQLPGGLVIRVPSHDREALGAVWQLVKVPPCSV